MRRLILWDIDGTLVRCGDISLSVFDSALEAVVGRPPPRRIFMAGKTDPQIVAEYLDLLEIEPGSVEVGVVLGELERTGVVMPGIEAILTRIDADRRQLVGIAVARVAARFGRHFAPEETWVVGDAPNDLAAARSPMPVGGHRSDPGGRSRHAGPRRRAA